MMKTKKCALFLFEGYADWEPALAITGLKNYGGYDMVTFSLDMQPFHSMGGIKVLPDFSMTEIDPADFDLLILPGGEAWEQGGNTEIFPLIKSFHQAGKVIAAICGATLSLAHSGLLDHIPHTSNDLQFLKQCCPTYQGADHYQNTPCVDGGQIITANGAGMIEFALAIYRKFKIADPETLKKVELLYKSGGMDNQLFEG